MILETRIVGGTGMATGKIVEEVAISENSRPAMSAYSMRGQGALLILISAAVFSSAGLFVKGVAADSWTILF